MCLIMGYSMGVLTESYFTPFRSIAMLLFSMSCSIGLFLGLFLGLSVLVSFSMTRSCLFRLFLGLGAMTESCFTLCAP